MDSKDAEETAGYLIILQAKNGHQMFQDRFDYKHFFRVARKYRIKYEQEILGYCMMPKQIYIVLADSNRENVNSFAGEITDSYGLFCRFKYREKNFIRRRVVRIKSMERLVRVIKRLEFKPVLEHLAENPVQYPYSSCADRVLDKEDDGNILGRKKN